MQVTSRWDRPFLCDYFAKISTAAIGSALDFRRRSAVRQAESAYARRALALHRIEFADRWRSTHSPQYARPNMACARRNQKENECTHNGRLAWKAGAISAWRVVGVATVACRHQCCDQPSGSYLKES